jgi:hypothetical protein
MINSSDKIKNPRYLPSSQGPNDSAEVCWCGANMKPAGRGAYPYNCIARDEYPDAMVYIGCEAGHTSWTYEKP